jgi:hypothetical protein
VKRYKAHVKTIEQTPVGRPSPFASGVAWPPSHGTRCDPSTSIPIRTVPLNAASDPTPIPLRSESPSALREAHIKTQTHLEALPHKILQHAKTFYEHVQYFVTPGGGALPVDSGYGAAGAENGLGTVGGDTSVPEWLRNFFHDIAGSESIGERMKEELLADNDSRNVRILSCFVIGHPENDSLLDQTLFILSIESLSISCLHDRQLMRFEVEALVQMIETAEEAMAALAERDRILMRHQQEQSLPENTQRSNSGDAIDNII